VRHADRPFRFLVQCSSPTAVDLASWRELARRCKGLGYAALTVSDHLDEQVGPVAALTAAATVTTTLRLGAMVFCNDSHPVVLAKEAATIDALSDADVGPNATVAATDETIGWVRAAAGDRWDDIEPEVRIQVVVVTDDRRGVAEALAPRFGLTPDEALASPHALCGTTGQIADDVIERRDRFGISAIGVPLEALDALAPVVAKLAGT
jgi:alkanesulfonate monooxygenase SsuD/methylene tetrahydromethanopterin reductase-like flavin-dependent oxidoreductase (luciferase family)